VPRAYHPNAFVQVSRKVIYPYERSTKFSISLVATLLAGGARRQPMEWDANGEL